VHLRMRFPALSMCDVPKDGGLLGHYANYLNVGYNDAEFVLDFGQFYQDEDQRRVTVRIVTNPSYAKNFSEALAMAVRKHEREFGPVPKE